MPDEIKGQVLVYSIIGCPFCIRTKSKLEELGLPYVDINLDSNFAARNQMIELTGKKTVPQIFFNEVHVGGFSELNALSSEELNRLIKKVTDNEAPPEAPRPPKTQKDDKADQDDFDFTCELDEYAAVVKELKESGLVRDIRQKLTTHKNSFVGREAVDWLVRHKDLERPLAIEMCRILIDKHFGHAVKAKGQVEFRDDDTIYRFLEDTDSNALNAGLKSDCEPRPASEVGEELRKLILVLYNENLSRDGKKVDYGGIAKSEKFKAYVKHTAELHRVVLQGITREEKIAFFINVYNALVIHAFVTVGPPVNLWQRYKFFNVISYIIGGHVYSLNEIENGVLRSNRKPIGAFRKPFQKTDPRYTVALPRPEPRVHFALVCGAKSCPPIKTYSAKDLDNQLNLATESFLESDDGLKVDIKKREIKLSQILKWYKEDFGRNKEEVAQWVHNHIGASQKKDHLEELLQLGFKLGYMPYDWGVNSK